MGALVPRTNYQLVGIISLIIVNLVLITASEGKECDRGNSRHVQKIIESEINQVYERMKINIPTECPLDASRSMYITQEKMKYREHPSKWICYQCGKSFYDERFIDKHMDNRHPFLQKKGSDIHCLADLCDVFRCEVLSADTQPSYWTRALCSEQELSHRRNSCQELISKCVPPYLETDDKQSLTEALNSKLCNYLNCKSYWELPQTQINPLSTALYVIAFMVISVALFFYYYVAYTHFYWLSVIFEYFVRTTSGTAHFNIISSLIEGTDDSIWDQFKGDDQQEMRQRNREIRYTQLPHRDELRQRHR